MSRTKCKMSTSPKHLIPSVVVGFGKLWQSLAVQPGSLQWCRHFIIACLHGFGMTECTQNHFWWEMESTRLCTGTDTVQHDVLCHAYKRFSRLWCWLPNHIPLWWQTVQPKNVGSKIWGTDKRARWASLCRWYGKECKNRDENATAELNSRWKSAPSVARRNATKTP